MESRTPTNPELLAALRRAAQHKMTPREMFEQRVSFVFGQQDYDSPVQMTKDEIRQRLIASGCGYPGMPAAAL